MRRNIEGTKRLRDKFWLSRNHNEERKEHDGDVMILIGAGYILIVQYLVIFSIATGPSL